MVKILYSNVALMLLAVFFSATAVIFGVYGALAAIAALAFLAAVASSYNSIPKLVLLAIVAFVPFDYITKLGGTLTLTKFLFPIGFGVLILDWLLNRRKFIWNAQCALVTLFGIAVVLSFLLNLPFNRFALNSLIRYFGVISLFFFAANVLENENDIKLVLWTMLVSCVLSSMYDLSGQVQTVVPGLPVPGLFQGRRMVSSMVAEHVGRLMGLSSVNPNTFGTYLLTAAVIAFYFMAVEKRMWIKFILLVCVLLLALGITMTLSRGVTLVALIIAPFLFYFLRKKLAPVTFIVLLFIPIFILIPFIPGQYYERIMSLIKNPSMDHPFMMRMSFNRVAFNLFLERPLFGFGPGGFSSQFTSEQFRFIAETFGQWKMVHNLLLAIACNIGAVGLILFLFMIRRAFVDLRSVTKFFKNQENEMTHLSKVVQLALIVFLLNALFLPAEYEKYMWVLFGISTALSEILKKNNDLSRAPQTE